MTDMAPLTLHQARLSPRDFARLAQLVEGHTGIKLPQSKQTMVEGRLRRRLRQLGMAGFSEYCDYLFKNGGLEAEMDDIVDSITTNKTDFFREPAHFEHLVARVLPDMVGRSGVGRQRPLRVWSVASSTGPEPYTLAMVLDDAARRGLDFRFMVLGTDICTSALATARKGIYPRSLVEPVPPTLRQRYLMRSRRRDDQTVRVVPELRRLVAFRHFNLMDDRYPVDGTVDVMFCRNVIIYFERATQIAVLSRLCRHLAPGSYLFMGHAENLGGMDLPLVQVVPTVYRRV